MRPVPGMESSLRGANVRRNITEIDASFGTSAPRTKIAGFRAPVWIWEALHFLVNSVTAGSVGLDQAAAKNLQLNQRTSITHCTS